MRFEDLRGRARPVPDRDERTVQIRRLAPAPEEDLGRITFARRQGQPSHRLIRREHIGGKGKYVYARAVRSGRRDSAAQDAYRPVVDASNASLDLYRDIPSRHRPIEDQPAE